jgi:hypothetical protein
VQRFEQQSLFEKQQSMRRLQVRQFLTLVFGAGQVPESQDCPLGAHVRMLFWAHGVLPGGQPQMLWDLS